MRGLTRFFLPLIYSFFVVFSANSQNYAPPLRIPPSLSANFGELRNNHFHSGIDYKTQQVENKPVYSIADGYVSRISVSPGGYGLALYIDHPTGHTSVYGHLNSFSKKIAEYVLLKQYENETYRINLTLTAEEIPIKKGEIIALSGNTGGSGGPHLHFEIRDTQTQDPLDVLEFLGNTITDTRKPDVRGVAFYPQAGKGVINGSANPHRVTIGKTKSGGYTGVGAIQAWGVIGLGVKAHDVMNGTTNIYGVKHVRLFVDENLVFSSTINRFSFDKTRMLNSFVDFEDWRENRSFYMKSFVEPGNTLPLYNAMLDGTFHINAERNYKVRYELEDHHGNKTVYPFTLTGKKQPIPESEKCKNHMTWNVPNWFFSSDCSLSIPLSNLYSDICFKHAAVRSARYLSDIQQVNYKPVPLHKNGQLWIKLTSLHKPDTSKIGIVRIAKNGKESWLGGTYKNGGVEVGISELGDRYAIDIDTVPPQIIAQVPTEWVQKKRISIKLTDAKSGIKTFRGEIDNQFVLFKHDVKSDVYTYLFDDTRLSKGQSHTLTFEAADNAGNLSLYRHEFVY